MVMAFNFIVGFVGSWWAAYWFFSFIGWVFY